jgi:hypothetical protein
MKLSAGGDYLWHTFYRYPTGSVGAGVAVGADGGAIVIAGDCREGWTGPADESPLHEISDPAADTDDPWSVGEVFVLGLSPSGAYRWHTFYGCPLADHGSSVADDDGGGIYVGGSSHASWSGPDGESPLHAHSGGGAEGFVLKLAD